MTIVLDELLKKQDLKYKEFSAKLIPNISKEKIIGVRTPILRKLAKGFTKEEQKAFLNILPHNYLEENSIHALFIENISTNINEIFDYLDKFLPYVDNWATCDLMSFKIFKNYKVEVFKKIKEWLKSEKEYVVRFGIDMLIGHFIETEYVKKSNELLSLIQREEYYINMAIAWYYSFALIKKYDETIIYFENRKLNKWVHNKSLQKAIESYRISDEIKIYLKSLKIK